VLRANGSHQVVAHTNDQIAEQLFIRSAAYPGTGAGAPWGAATAVPRIAPPAMSDGSCLAAVGRGLLGEHCGRATRS
jgi:hypothetical protein